FIDWQLRLPRMNRARVTLEDKRRISARCDAAEEIHQRSNALHEVAALIDGEIVEVAIEDEQRSPPPFRQQPHKSSDPPIQKVEEHLAVADQATARRAVMRSWLQPRLDLIQEIRPKPEDTMLRETRRQRLRHARDQSRLSAPIRPEQRDVQTCWPKRTRNAAV